MHACRPTSKISPDPDKQKWAIIMERDSVRAEGRVSPLLIGRQAPRAELYTRKEELLPICYRAGGVCWSLETTPQKTGARFGV